MKIVVALHLLVVICAASSSDLWENHMKYEKQISFMNVDDAIQILQNVNDKAQRDYETEAENNFDEQTIKYMKIRGSTIDAIYAEVEDAKVEGKDAQICYDNSRKNIFDISIEARNNGFQCFKSGQKSLKNKLVFIEKLIEKANLLKEKLDQHNRDMHNTQIEETELRDQAMGNLKALQDLQNDVKTATKTASFTSESVGLETDICFQHIVLDAHRKITNLQLDASKCIKAI